MSMGGGGAVGDGDDAPDFEAWARARGPALLKFAYLVTGDRGRAEEAVQDALVSVCPRWHRIVRGGNPEAYVRRSIVNADRALWRRFRRRETLVAGVPFAALVDVADEVATRDAAWGLCLTLPRRQRAAVVLRYYEGLSDAEIGAILGCSPATVRSQIHRALAALRQRLRTQEEVGQG
jgi:RNA polymerase sigma-70 factor (sigma-E family)